jgi:sulfur transfer complex TusBCD TusB component (DsrH family)
VIPQDTPNTEQKSEFLPPLQRRIILFLAGNQPMNKHATAKAMNEHTRSTWLSFKGLENSGLVKKIDQRESLGRERDCYWLTDSGVYLALIEGAESKKILMRTKEVYPDNALLHFIIEIAPIMGTGMHKIGYSAVLEKGKLGESDKNSVKSAMLSQQLLKELTLGQIRDLIEIMKKHPQFEAFKDQTDQALEKLKKAELFLKEAYEK